MKPHLMEEKQAYKRITKQSPVQFKRLNGTFAMQMRGIDYIKEWIPSSRNPATVHWTVALDGFDSQFNFYQKQNTTQ